jgi:3-oxoacyl-[acyl-carrier-protein] synthase II
MAFMSEPRIVITGTGLVCPEASSVAQISAPSPPADNGAAIDGDWFDPVPYLGRRGWKYFSPATRYLLAAASRALAESELPTGPEAPPTGVAVGTNFAVDRPVAHFDRTIIDDDAEAISPAEAPGFSVNIPASQISLRYGMRAFNLTLTNPVVAGMEAMVVLAGAIRTGRAVAGVAGATEQAPDLPTVHPAASEGACCFVLERAADARARGAAPHAEVVGGFSRFIPPRELCRPQPETPRTAPAGSVAAVVGRPLAALVAGHQGPLPLAVLSGPVDATRWRRFCATACGHVGVPVVDTDYLGGDGRHFTVSPLLAAAGLVGQHGCGLVVCTSPHGHVAALYLRRADPPSGGDRG